MAEEYINKEQDRRITSLESCILDIKKHLATMNAEMGSVKTDICWIKRFIFILLPTLLGVIVSLVYMALKLRSI